MTTRPQAPVAASQWLEQNAGLDRLRGVYAAFSAKGASGRLGGHLTMARKVGSLGGAFGLDAVGTNHAPGAGTGAGSAQRQRVLRGGNRSGVA